MTSLAREREKQHFLLSEKNSEGCAWVLIKNGISLRDLVFPDSARERKEEGERETARDNEGGNEVSGEESNGGEKRRGRREEAL